MSTSAAALPIVCEYFIQNDECDDTAKSHYPNIFILPKKYVSVNEVRVKDIIDAFPLTQFDTQHKYLLRFQTVMQINPARKMVVWMDLDHELDV